MDTKSTTIDKTNKSYHKTILYSKLKELLLITYKLTNKLPRSEDFVIKPQMKRAVISVLSNYAEGYLKRSSKEKLRFLEIAQTSLLELEIQGEICQMLKYWNNEEFNLFEQKRGIAAYFLYQYKLKIPQGT